MADYIEDDFVSHEQAVQLAEIGFDGIKWDCEHWWYTEYGKKGVYFDKIWPSEDLKNYWYAPTLGFVRKWFSAVKGLVIGVTPRYSMDGEGKYGLNYTGVLYTAEGQYLHCSLAGTYEKALSLIIDEAIKTVKENKYENSSDI